VTILGWLAFGADEASFGLAALGGAAQGCAFGVEAEEINGMFPQLGLGKTLEWGHIAWEWSEVFSE
jgi:hypothetical protein